jgi:molecular chaperone DnaK (HSP70)
MTHYQKATIGIDLGSSTSVIAALKKGGVEVITN